MLADPPGSTVLCWRGRLLSSMRTTSLALIHMLIRILLKNKEVRQHAQVNSQNCGRYWGSLRVYISLHRRSERVLLLSKQ